MISDIFHCYQGYKRKPMGYVENKGVGKGVGSTEKKG